MFITRAAAAKGWTTFNNCINCWVACFYIFFCEGSTISYTWMNGHVCSGIQWSRMGGENRGGYNCMYFCAWKILLWVKKYMITVNILQQRINGNNNTVQIEWLVMLRIYVYIKLQKHSNVALRGKLKKKKMDYTCRILQYPINLLEDFTFILFEEIDDINWEVRAELVRSNP